MRLSHVNIVVSCFKLMVSNMYHFCTYFDRNYLTRGVALYQSLAQYYTDFRLWVLCLDPETYAIMTQLHLPGIQLITLDAFERDDEPLRRAKQNRSWLEYYFTCTPCLPLYILKHWSEVTLITYLDADLFFFADPTPLFKEMGSKSIAIIANRFPLRLKFMESVGIYNVGWLSFRRDENGLACLQRWREQCLDWCYRRGEEGRFADQKYLDEWPSRFQNVVVLEHKGANVALWNIDNYRLHAQREESLLVDDQPLIFYHFHALKRIKAWLYDPYWRKYNTVPPKLLRQRVYATYIQKLSALEQQAMSSVGLQAGLGNHKSKTERQRKQVYSIQQISRRCKNLLGFSKNILVGRYIFVVRGYPLTYLNRY